MRRSKVGELQQMKERGEKIAMLTAYDYPTARLLDESGIDVLLVGDSLGMVVLGYPDTTHVTMEEMLHHTRAVVRGVTRALIIADLPFGSYTTPEEAVENARRLVEAGAEGVKLEGGSSESEKIAAIVSSGIPIMAHLGMLPQSVLVEGGYKRKGKTASEAAGLIEDARAVQHAGAFAMVLELVKTEAAQQITAAVQAPTIGIGSGPHCDGQVLVTHDLIGHFPWFTPRFAQPRAAVAAEIRRAAEEFRDAIKHAE